MSANYTVKESLTMALIRLMETKPYEKITVTDIVNKSGVSRASFYRNYSDKEDILRNYIRYAMKSCPEYYSEQSGTDEKKQVHDVCKAIRENQPLFEALKKNHLLHLLHEQILNMVLSHISRHHLQLSRYEIAFLSHAGLGILLEWIDGGCHEDETTLTELYLRFLRMPE